MKPPTPTSTPAHASVLLLPSPQDDTLQCLWIDADGTIRARGPLDRQPTDPTAAPGRASGSRCVLAVPGCEVGSQWLELNARNDAQALAAARLLLEDRLAASGDLHVVVAPARGMEARRQVLYVDPAVLRHQLERARAFGFEPDLATPDYMLLPAPEAAGDGDDAQAATVVFERAGQWLVRGPELAFACEAGLAETVLAAAAQTPTLADPGQVEARLARGAAGAPVDLLRGRFARDDARPSDSPRWRRVAILAGLLALSPLLLAAVDAVRYGLAASALRGEAAATVQALTGVAADAADPLVALQDALAAGSAGDRFARLNAALHTAIAATPALQLERLDYDRDAGLEAIIAHPARGDLEPLRTHLADAGLRLQVRGSHDSGAGLSSTILIDAGVAHADASPETTP